MEHASRSRSLPTGRLIIGAILVVALLLTQAVIHVAAPDLGHHTECMALFGAVAAFNLVVFAQLIGIILRRPEGS